MMIERKLSNRNINLDLMKIIACIAVIGLHTFMPGAMFLYYLCGFAVPMFFMASGYILLNSHAKCGGGVYTKKVYSVLRIVVLWNIVRYLISISGIFVGKDISQYSITYLIDQSVKSLLQKGKMWHFWYMGTLLILYLILPVINRIYAKAIMFRNIGIRLKHVLWGVMILISVGIQICSLVYKEALQQHVVQTFRLWSWMQYFMLGGLVFDIQPQIVKKISLKVHLLLLCGLTIFIIEYQYILGKYVLHTMYAEYFYDSIVTIVWIFALFTFVLRLQISKSSGKWISTICPLTLGVYIVHPIVISVMPELILINGWITSLCSFIIVLFTSFAIVGLLSKIKYIKKCFLTL